MRLTTKGRFAVTAMVDLALRGGAEPVTLAEIKGDRTFAGWELVRLPRLSVMPVPDAMQARLLELAAS